MRIRWAVDVGVGLLAAASCLGSGTEAPSKTGVEDGVAWEDRRAGKDEDKRYFLIERKGEKPPAKGSGLLIVLPGGPGTADFLPFVRSICKRAVPEGYVVAQPVSVRWAEDQRVIWPTRGNRVERMRFTTEELVEAVIQDVQAARRIDPERVFTLSWSSSGPAAYAVSLSGGAVKGSFIAMSVFTPDLLPPLENAKGHAYYLFHSPGDRICPFRMAERASKEMEAHGAKARLTSYAGGHGWHGDLFGEIRLGMEWLEGGRTVKEGGKRPDGSPEAPPTDRRSGR